MKILKITLLSVLALLLTASFSNDLLAQKSNKDIVKQVKKELKDKPLKIAKKEAKRLKKQGYYVPPGKLPLMEQLEKSYIKQAEDDENGIPRWITGEATSIANTKIAAKNQAIEAAKLELAGKLETTIVGLVENSFANNQINMEEAASLTKTVTASKNVISQKIGRIIVLLEAYRDLDNKNVEATMTIAYSFDTALQQARETLREELEEDAEDLHNKLDKILDLDN